MCLRYSRLPADIDEVMRRAYEPASEAQLVVCMRHQHTRVALSGPMAIQMPPLQIRQIELPRIIEEYAVDAIAALGAQSGSFTEEDRWWVMTHSAQSLHEIEKATLRLVALASSQNVSQAAARLGMAPVSLARWFGRRPPCGPDSVPPEVRLAGRTSVPRSSTSTAGPA
jgi:hypothetical protein